MAAAQWVSWCSHDAPRGASGNHLGLVGRGDPLNVWHVRPVAQWFGLRVREQATGWFWTHLTHARSDAAFARLGLFNFVGISSHPTWKGQLAHRDCFPLPSHGVVGAAWILLWVTVALMGSLPDRTPVQWPMLSTWTEAGCLLAALGWTKLEQPKPHGSEPTAARLAQPTHGRKRHFAVCWAGAVLIAPFWACCSGMAGYLEVGWTQCCRGLQVMWSIPTLLMVLHPLAFGKDSGKCSSRLD